MNFTSFLAVASGGAIGAMARYGIHQGLTVMHGGAPAWSTLGINVIGSVLLGLAAGLLTHRDSTFALFFMIGVCGAFTTFSTFALDIVVLFRDRGLGVMAAYLSLSVVLSVAGFLVGLLLSRGNFS